MPHILLVGINAKFIHSNLAIRSLKGYAQEVCAMPVSLAEYTINQQTELILREIYRQKPDILGFSCYIWNYELVKILSVELKKLLPHCILLLGGPEVSYNPQEVLTQTGCDFVLCGEGEQSFCALISALCDNSNYGSIAGIAYQTPDGIIVNPPCTPVKLEEIPFAYTHDSFELLQNRIVYYESSRGCPFQCQYCLSGDGGSLRQLPLERVYADLSHFLEAGVRQVKFVDRTFNCNKSYAMAIWKFLREQDNGITNFHFEIAAELLDDEMIAWLNTVRKGLFQFEIGVQSTNPETLAAIKRITLPEKLTPIIKSLQKGQNIHLHLDLIAGLPFEGYVQFKDSFNYVYCLSPEQLQLGFLKLLKGSGLYTNRARYGLVCSDYAPYEVLTTDWLTYDELLRLKMVEELCESYYNAGRYRLALAYLVSLFAHPFAMFEAFGDYYETNKLHLAPHSKVEYYDILFDFQQSLERGDSTLFKWLCLYDIYAHEKAKKLPAWLTMSVAGSYRKQFFDFVENPDNRARYFTGYESFDTKQILRMVHFEVFPFDPRTMEQKETVLLFCYETNSIHEVTL